MTAYSLVAYAVAQKPGPGAPSPDGTARVHSEHLRQKPLAVHRLASSLASWAQPE